MRVGFYSPLPPARTGVADYSAALLRALRRHGEIEIARDGDLNLYHIGNNQIHREIYRRALERPGAIVLHDAVLQHFFLGSLTEEEYVEEFVFNYGEWRRSLGRELWRNRASSGFNAKYFSYPMLKRVAQAARIAIVHNAAAAALVREHAPETRVVEIPHLFEPAETPDAAEIHRFRARLGIAPEAFLFGVFGYLRESKRIIATLRCFEKLGRAKPKTALLVAGQFVSPELARAAAPLLLQPGIARIGHLSDAQFQVAGAAVDACINLRYPSAAETSGIAIRLMGAGKPALLTSGPETAAYPDAACFRVPPGVAEQSGLFDYMVMAAAFPEAAREVGRQAARHIRSRHSLERVAGLYWETLCSSRD